MYKKGNLPIIIYIQHIWYNH